MNSQLGRGDSMDVLDALHMLMSVYEHCEMGAEIETGRKMAGEESSNADAVDIYDDSFWA